MPFHRLNPLGHRFRAFRELLGRIRPPFIMADCRCGVDVAGSPPRTWWLQWNVGADKETYSFKFKIANQMVKIDGDTYGLIDHC